MKKIYSLFAFGIFTTFSFAQSVVITGYADSVCPSDLGNTLEIYVNGTVNLNGWSIERQSDGGGFTTSINISGLGQITNDFAYITNSIATFNDEFGITTTHIIQNTSINSNGDDAFQIVDNTDTVIDRFGEENIDGSGTGWEHTNSYYYRDDNASPNGGSFNVNNWMFGTSNRLSGEGNCEGSLFSLGDIVPFNTYQAPVLSIQENELQHLQFPTLITNKQLYVTIPNNINTIQVSIFNVLGKKIIQQQLTKNQNRIGLSSLPSGVYLAKFSSDTSSITKKIVVK